MNILIKLMSIVSLVIAPSIATIHADSIQKHRMEHLKTSMEACRKAGCTEAQCAEVMGSAACTTPGAEGKKACCSEGETTSASAETTTTAEPTTDSPTSQAPGAVEDPSPAPATK